MDAGAIKSALTQFDTRGTGHLSLDELFAVLTRPTGNALTDEEVYDIFRVGEFGCPSNILANGLSIDELAARIIGVKSTGRIKKPPSAPAPAPAPAPAQVQPAAAKRWVPGLAAIQRFASNLVLDSAAGFDGYGMHHAVPRIHVVTPKPADQKATACTCKMTRMCFTQNMQPAELECLTELVGTVGSILDASSVRWSPVAGSLLAVYRHDSLVIPWDDDYDIAVHGSDEERALELLRELLPGRHAQLTRLGCVGPRSWGTMYKASFRTDHPRWGASVLRAHRMGAAGEYTWPFVDVFIRGTEAGPMGVKCLSDAELPLLDVTIGDVTLHVPSRGPRCSEDFRRRRDLMEEAVEQTHSHRYERYCPGLGPQRLPLARAANLARNYAVPHFVHPHESSVAENDTSSAYMYGC